MNVGDCFVELRKNRGHDDQFVLSRILRFKKLCLVEEILIGTEQQTHYEYLDLLTRRRSPSKLAALKTLPIEKYQQIYASIKNLSKECQQLIDSNSRPVSGHKTTKGDCYCQNGRVEHVLDYVYFFRPSWNVDFISFNENGFSDGHYRFGVDVDKYDANQDSWLLTEESVYDSIREKYVAFIETLRDNISIIV